MRTRDMAPSYKEPTVQESHSLPLDRQNKRMYVRERKVRGREKKWLEQDLVQPESHDKPNRETSGLFLISAPCLHPSNLFYPFLLPSFWPGLPFPCVCCSYSPLHFFFFWCEMNIKALLHQLGGLQQNLIGVRDPLAC